MLSAVNVVSRNTAEQPKHQEGLNVEGDVPKLDVMRGRVLFGLALGIAGICLGVIGAVLSLSLLVIAAGVCAIGGCFVIAGVTLIPLVKRTSQPNDEIGDGLRAAMNDATGDFVPDMPDHTVIDPVTELPDGRYFEVAVESRVAAARRHLWPVSIVLVQLGYGDGESPESRNRSLKSFANVMRQTLREADIACRINETTFGLILEDTSEEGGVWTAERLQIALAHDSTTIRKLVAGVAAYPTHGLFSKDVLVRARAALNRASSTPAGHGLGQVEVAHVDLS
jgi:diguanylate cyclase (GGDEF)-like protein